MAYLFITDGGPDAEDFDNNYYEYDQSNPETLRNIRYIQDHFDTQDPNVRAKLIAICKASCCRLIAQDASKSSTDWYRNLAIRKACGRCSSFFDIKFWYDNSKRKFREII